MLLYNDLWWKKPASASLASSHQTISLRLIHRSAQKDVSFQTTHPASKQPASKRPEQPETPSTPPQREERPSLKPVTTQQPAHTPRVQKAADQPETERRTVSTEAAPTTESPEISGADAYSSPLSSQASQTSDFEQWLATLQSVINQNKTYPYQAQRRNLSGSVEVMLEVNPDGSLMKAEIIRGRKVFHNSTLRAIRNAFPASRTHKDAPVIVHLTVHYQLR
ncbi:TonB family protein [Endozoicomonas gorgoniicola]|uniref:TonB family protein n=1 Tax=Endozoicomonas gorgoniicola TaxID=1234144 RepID=A0ABT3N3G5_9GAMM|nr:TonB family protein [Endozoicomonas gorgoniicola]MCW7556172.1 TonB family protein [Endozoicomonas gorgoniicola]